MWRPLPPSTDRWRGRLRARGPARRDLDLVAVHDGLRGCEDLASVLRPSALTHIHGLEGHQTQEGSMLSVTPPTYNLNCCPSSSLLTTRSLRPGVHPRIDYRRLRVNPTLAGAQHKMSRVSEVPARLAQCAGVARNAPCHALHRDKLATAPDCHLRAIACT